MSAGFVAACAGDLAVDAIILDVHLAGPICPVGGLALLRPGPLDGRGLLGRSSPAVHCLHQQPFAPPVLLWSMGVHIACCKSPVELSR